MTTPYVAIGADDLGEPADVIDCARCGRTHAIEYGTSRTLRPNNTWSEPVPSQLLGWYTCRGQLYVGTIEGMLCAAMSPARTESKDG